MRVRRDIAVAALFVIFSIAMTWPLSMHLRDAGGDDSLTSTWAIDWDYYATFHHVKLFDANMFSPARLSLAFGEHLYGVAMFAFPLLACGIAPLTAHNVLLLLGFAGCGFAMYLVARRGTDSTAAAIVAGIAYAFAGIRFHHLAHVHLVWTMWFPLLLLASIDLVDAPTPRRSASLALLMIVNGLTSLHWFAFGTLTTAVTIVVLAFAMERARDKYLWLFATASLAIAAAVLTPFLLPYARAARMYGMHRDYAAVIANGARWHDWLVPNLQNKLYGWLAGDEYGHERTLFPGFITLALAFVGLFADVRRIRVIDGLIIAALFATTTTAVLGRGVAVTAVVTATLVAFRLIISRPQWRRNPLRDPFFLAATVWLLSGAWGARGLHGSLHEFLFKYTMVFRGMRMPARWAFVAYVGVDLFAAFGMQRLLANRSRRTAAAIAIVVAAALMLELRAAPIRFFLMPREARPVYAWLDSVSLSGAVLELPMTQTDAYTYLWRATTHHQRLMNGVTSYIPPHYERLQSAYDARPISPTFLGQLEALHCALIIVHAEELGTSGEAVRAWLKENLASGRLAFVRRFDGGTRGDYVFSVTRSASFHGAAQDAQRFLNGEWTYNAQPIASIDIGPPIGTTRGKFTVSGWALAPAGIREVNLRFANGVYVVRASRFPRLDVNDQLPWYTHDPHAGFAATLDTPPRSIAGDTDMQLELVDNVGTRVRKRPFWFRWLPAPRFVVVWKEPEVTALLQRLGANTAQNRERLFSGSAAIHDFTPALLRDSEVETNIAFVGRIIPAILGDHIARLENASLEMLENGTSRERVIFAILRSPEFRTKYVRAGRVEID